MDGHGHDRSIWWPLCGCDIRRQSRLKTLMLMCVTRVCAQLNMINGDGCTNVKMMEVSMARLPVKATSRVYVHILVYINNALSIQ